MLYISMIICGKKYDIRQMQQTCWMWSSVVSFNSLRPTGAYICASVNYTIIGSDNGLSHVRRQPIVWTINGLLSIRPQGTYFNEIIFEIQKFPFKKMHMKMSSAKMVTTLSWPQCVNSLHSSKHVSEHANCGTWPSEYLWVLQEKEQCSMQLI